MRTRFVLPLAREMPAVTTRTSPARAQSSRARSMPNSIVLGSLSLSGVGFLLLPRPDGVAGIVAACVLIGAGQGGTTGPMMALIADLTPDERMGRAMGTNNVLGDVGGALGPLVSLPLVESVGFAPVYVACALIPVAAGGVLLVGVRAETGEVNPSLEAQTGD